MTSKPSLIRIRNREHLLSTLAEAAELEHNLMCLYLYAVFSLKQSTDEGLTAQELAAVQGWRKKMMEVSVQEMCHLALVSNLTKAVGGSPHFHRSSFPISPGYFPAEFVIELAPFDQDTLDHFIFLERPESEAIEDGSSFIPEEDYHRTSPKNRLMTHVGDYQTVGQLYQALQEGIEFLSNDLGEANLFCGAHSLQLSEKNLQLEGLTAITDKASALTALRFIVEQGEGAPVSTESHFAKFNEIKTEYETLLRANPSFKPARPALRNPSMRKPVQAEDERVWVTDPTAAKVMDLGNAVYVLMLRTLTQLYFMEDRKETSKKNFLDAAFTLMHALGKTGSLLTQLPAGSADSNAGLSFALERHFHPLELKNESFLLRERWQDILATVEDLHSEQALLKYRHSLKEIWQALSDGSAKYF